MSLVRIAARIALVQALKGHTLVGDRVKDSVIGAIDIGADGNIRLAIDKPFIAIFSEASKVEKNLDLRSMKENGMTEFLIEWGISISQTVTDPDTGESRTSTGSLATDDELEMQMDMVGRQIGDALTDPENGWAEIYRSLVYSITKVERFRTSNDQDGVRVAGQQLKITAELMDDPIKGEAPPDPFPQLFAMMASAKDKELAGKAKIMQAQLDAGPNLPWETVQRILGITSAERTALGVGKGEDP